MAQFFAKDPALEYLPNHINTSLDLSAVNVPDDPRQVAEMRKAVYGELIAWDPFAQKAVWRVRHPWLVNGGVLATAGNLVFQGTAEGRLVAYDASDGRELWSYPTTNGIIAPPISYRLDGKQYIAVLVGYGGPTAMYGTITPYRPRLPGRLMVFTLGGKVKPEPFAIAAAEPVDLTGVTSPGDAAKGGISYNQNCMVCHGMSATGRYTADLRRSQIIKNPEAFKNVVIDGALADNGMVSFAKFVTPEQAENIRAYLIQEAQKLAKSGDIQNWPPKPGE
jgi:mono/diheme cytochrome c family protein